MDKPQVTVPTTRQVSDSAYRAWPPRTSKESGHAFFSWLTGSGGKTQIFLPALLAVITGVLLGMCMLVVFKGQASQPPSLAAKPPGQATAPASADQATPPASAPAGQVQLPGVTLYAWQVGSFGEWNKAEVHSQELNKKGVQAAIRKSGPFQLFAGVAADKNAGGLIASELQKKQVSFYAKEFKIEPRQGTIKGLQDAEAGQIAQALSNELKLAEALLPIAVSDKRDAEKVKALGSQVSAVDLKNQVAMLEKAGRTEQSANLQAMHKKLTEAAMALTTPGILGAQSKLAAFYVSYESLVGELVTVQ